MKALLPGFLALLGACAAAPTPQKDHAYVHPESARDALLVEVLDAVPPEWAPPSALEIAVKAPLVVPWAAIEFARLAPGAVLVVLLAPVELGACLLEAVGLIDRTRPSPREPGERAR